MEYMKYLYEMSHMYEFWNSPYGVLHTFAELF